MESSVLTLSRLTHPEICVLDLPCFENGTVYSKFKGVKYQNKKTWATNCIEPCQATKMCRLAWLYTHGKGLSLSFPACWELINNKKNCGIKGA
jgi:hypothetical protein